MGILTLRETNMTPINVGVPRLVNISWSYKAIQQVPVADVVKGSTAIQYYEITRECGVCFQVG